MARHITPPHPQSRGSDFELAYASPTVTKEQGADTESIRRYNRKCRGPLCLNDEAGTLYPDGRNRRLRGASDDAANPTADGYFVEHLRVGGPYLCPMPVYTSTTNIQPLDIPLPPSGSTGESFEDRVMKIIDKHRIQTPPIDLFPAEKDGGFGRMDPTSVWLAQRGSGRYDEPEHLVDTLAILATRASLEDPWLDCVRDLREMLCHENLAHVCVEVVDGQAYGIRNANQRLYTFPVFASDEIFAKWESVLGVILETVDLTDIRSISCYRRGRRKDVDVNPPTVLIIADTESNRCWKSTRENVVQILNNFDLYMVAVEISKDFVLESSDWTMNKGIPPALLEAGNTKIGDSIALHQNTQSSGTLGGFVELQNPETHQWHPYALTCFRCVDPANLGGDISPKIEQWRREGISNPSEADRELLRVDHPSLLAKKEELKKHKGRVEKIENYFGDGRQHLGYVAFASGHRLRNFHTLGDKSYPTSLDWALISVSPERKASNKIEEIFFTGPYNLPSDAERTRIRDLLGHRHDLHGEEVAMRGYRTGPPRNKYDLVQAHDMYSALVDAHISTVTVDGQLKQCVTLGWSVVVTPRSGRWREPGCLFSRPGDEGALIYARSGGDVVGMLVGVSGFNNISRIIHTDHLVDDIKMSTSALDVRMVEPEYDSSDYRSSD